MSRPDRDRLAYPFSSAERRMGILRGPTLALGQLDKGRESSALCRNRSPWQPASSLLAYCDMRTLYLRNVPDDVVARLERLAARDATSVGAVAVRELAEVSRRADNPALLGSLPDFGVNAATILRDLDAGRADR
jgi:plasmid stability protein